MKFAVLALLLSAASLHAAEPPKSACEARAKAAFAFAKAKQPALTAVAPMPREIADKEVAKPATTRVRYEYRQVCVNGVCQLYLVEVRE